MIKTRMGNLNRVSVLRERRFIWPSIALLLVVTAVVAITAPAERILGSSARLVYLHGALVWAAMLAWFMAALSGVVGFVRPGNRWHFISRALGRVALLGWALYIPVSIVVANATWANNSWNLTFLLEPRFRMAFQLLAVMLLSQAVQFFDDRPGTASLANIVVVVVMVTLMGVTERVLHPPAPIRDTRSLHIQLAFAMMTGALLLAGCQLARLLLPHDAEPAP